MDIQLENKPDFDACCQRIEAWFHQEIIDRAPIRFHRHNAEYDLVMSSSQHASLKDRWMDAEFQAQSFLNSVKGKRFYFWIASQARNDVLHVPSLRVAGMGKIPCKKE